MTETTTVEETGTEGVLDVVYATVNISSLDSAGYEPYNPASKFNMERVVGASVVGVENSAYLVRWDHLNERLDVANVADATDVTAGTDVGEVRLRFVGV